MYTKRLLVSKLFGELALAGYEFDITPEEQQDAAGRMETMLAEWLTDGVAIGYRFAADPESIDLDADSGLALTVTRVVFTGAAIAVAASHGKNVSPDTRKAFAEGYGRLLRGAAFPPEQQLPETLPRGAGSRQWSTDNPFITPPDTAPLQVAADGGLNLGT